MSSVQISKKFMLVSHNRDEHYNRKMRKSIILAPLKFPFSLSETTVVVQLLLCKIIVMPRGDSFQSKISEIQIYWTI